MISPRTQMLFWGIFEIVLLIYSLWLGTQPILQNNYKLAFLIEYQLKALGFFVLSIGPALAWRHYARKSLKY